MVLDIDAWLVAIALTKWLIYCSGVTLIGGLFILWLEHRMLGPSVTHAPMQTSGRTLWPIFITAACLGATASIMTVLLQVGAINQRGLIGMFDGFMFKLIGQSSVGGGNGLKLAGFAVLGVALLISRTAFYTPNKTFQLPSTLVIASLFALAAFTASFAFLGHVAPLGLVAKLAIIAHVGAVSIWLGALFPLRLICTQRSPDEALPIMRAFGTLGWGVVIALLMGGIYLLFELLSGLDHLVSTTYGLLLSTKLLLALCLLGLAALNKFNLVSHLALGAPKALKRSIIMEILLALVILLITAIFTTLTGPMEAMS